MNKRWVLSGLLLAVVSAGLGSAAAFPLLVVNGGSNSATVNNVPQVAPANPFVIGGSGGLSNPRGIAVGPDRKLYVTGSVSQTQGGVFRYNGATGTFIDLFATTVDVAPFGITFGPDGNLYVANTNSNSVSRISANGTAIANFVAPGSGGLSQPRGIVFGADGNLYVASTGSTQVLRYSGTTGAFIDVFAANVDARGLAFGPEGNLYVANFAANNVLRFDRSTGAPLGVFASGGGLNGPVGVLFGADGGLYVSSFNNNALLQYNATTGAFVATIATNLSSPRLMAVAPTVAEYTDVYFNPDEAGRGYFVVQSEGFQFIAGFIQGPDGNPTWYTAELSLTPDGKSYTGPLYFTTASPFGAPWDPSKVASTQVGTASFTPIDAYHATIVFAVDGRPTVTTQVQRQSLLAYAMAGNYSGSMAGSQTNCPDPGDNFSGSAFRYTLQVTQVNDDSITLTFSFVDQDAGSVCTVNGSLTHLGRLYRVAGGQLSCVAPGDPGAPSPATIESLHPTGQGIEGRLLSADPGGCRLDLRFSAVRL
jgi:streptogramin lyase